MGRYLVRSRGWMHHSRFPSREPRRGALLVAVAVAAVAVVAAARPLRAQDSLVLNTSPRRFVLGVTSSLLLHEAGHVLASLLLGAHPSFGFDTGLPTVYSGFDAQVEP